MKEQFIPKIFFRNPLFQTVYGSLKIKRKSADPMSKASEEIILNGANGERLLGYYSAQTKDAKGAVLLIHGWEGSSDSSYIKSTAKYMFSRGYDILRLNLRDHGESHHLNKGIFKSTLIDETFTAVKNAAVMTKDRPFFIAGFSLGGNFALRIALKAGKSGIGNLKHVAAVSPVLDPMKSTYATDEVPIIRNYFLKKWKRSLIKKQALFPELYNFQGMEHIDNLTEMMDTLIPVYTEFKDTREYYGKYTLLNDTFKDLEIPVTVITSKDDPIIPVEDFYNLTTGDNMEVIIQPYGGHNGFVDFFPHRIWYEEKIAEIFSQISHSRL